MYRKSERPTHQQTPPRLAKKFLYWFLREDLAEEITGDLEEKFRSLLRSRSPFRAKLSYWYQVIHYLRPFAIRRLHTINQYGMFQNYFIAGWRNLSRHKMYSAVKIGGFAAGVVACLLIALFIRQELTYDLHYRNTDRIYRVIREGELKGERQKAVWFPASFANALQEDYPDIERAGHYLDDQNFGAGSNEVRRVEQVESTHEDGFVFMDQGLVEILEIPFIAGNPRQALTAPHTIVISKRIADKYFPGEGALGKELVLNNDPSRLYKVSGVMENFPVTSHLQANFLISLAGHEFWPGEKSDWNASNYLDYVLVREGTDVAQLEQKLSSLVQKYFLPAVNDNADAIAWTKSLRFILQPVHQIYLNQDGITDGLLHGDIRYTWLFGSIAIFILLIACINFINLSTARSANRAKEVGLRKVAGSVRGSLIKQFLTESLLFSFFSFAVALVLVWLGLPYFNVLLSKSLIFPWNEWKLWPVLIAGALSVGILAGMYPAFYLSSFKPVQVLKGNVSRGAKSGAMRSLLVVFQFTVSIVLIIGTFTMDRQMEYILNKKVGFDKDQVVILQGTHTLGDKIVTLKKELVRLPDVKHASIGDFLPFRGANRNGNPFWLHGRKDIDEGVDAQMWIVDHDYVETMGLKVTAGRDFSIEMPTDSQAVVLNEAMAKAFRLKDPIGKQIINGWGGTWTVIGVIGDFHFESVKETVAPLCLAIGRTPNAISVKVNTEDMAGTLSSIEKVWKEFSPNQAIRYAFLDESYARTYADVQRMGRLFTCFAVLAIIVACLGLFALSAFMIEQRGKEISIRLILGASVNSIFSLLTTNFVKLVLLSFVIAIPLAWYMMQAWLQDYVYKTELGWDAFLLAGIMAVLIALLTISYQALRAAWTKPVDVLKAE